MVDSKTIAIIWGYIDAFDRSGDPSFLITAMAIFEAVLEKAELPEGKITDVWVVTEKGGKELKAKVVKVTKENIMEQVSEWLADLFRFYMKKDTRPWVYQVIKVSLVKILTALGYVATPQETPLETIFEGEGEED